MSACDCRRRAVEVILGASGGEGDAIMRALLETLAAKVDRALGGDGSDFPPEVEARAARAAAVAL